MCSSSKLGNAFAFFMTSRDSLICYNDINRFTVSMRISEDDLSWSWETLETVFGDAHNVTLWSVPLALAVLLRLVTTKWHHQLIFPLCEFFCYTFSLGLLCLVRCDNDSDSRCSSQFVDFLIIPVVFYIVVAAAHLNLGALRGSGWLFDMGNTDAFPWYKFYSYFGAGSLFYIFYAL